MRVVQMLLDEGPDAQYEGLPVSFRWERAVGVEDVGEQRRQQVDHHCPELGPVSRPVGRGVIRQLSEQLCQQGAEAFAG